MTTVVVFPIDATPKFAGLDVAADRDMRSLEATAAAHSDRV